MYSRGAAVDEPLREAATLFRKKHAGAAGPAYVASFFPGGGWGLKPLAASSSRARAPSAGLT